MLRHRFSRPLTFAAFTLCACGGSAPPANAPTAPNAPAAGGAAAAPAPDASTDAKLRSAIASSDRPADEVARDPWRHPLETLEFFGVRDDMTVVELWPGGGWYTAILAPVLADKGKLVVTSMDPAGPPDDHAAQGARQYAARLASKPGDFAKVDVRVLHPPADLSLGPDGSADAVLTFRNFHNWVGAGIAEKVLAASFRVLKPGGIFGVEEHRAKADADPTKAGDTGYVPEAFVIDLAQKAGFKLDGRSEINANPKDTKDWPKGVWTLPPVLRLGDQDRAKYMAVGESDRMTLRFRKP
jgi:predicted methyltransferase